MQLGGVGQAAGGQPEAKGAAAAAPPALPDLAWQRLGAVQAACMESLAVRAGSHFYEIVHSGGG